MKRLVLLTCAAIYSIVLTGATSGLHRDISFTHISINDGLSQSTVRSACQDSRGQMWFATHDGLNRFDGYDFTVYRHRDDDSTSIADNIIRKVYLDSKGRLWVGTEKGLSFYDRDKDSFRNFSTGGKTVTGIAEDSNGRFIVATGGSLRIFNSNTWNWEISAPPCQPETFGATILYRDKEDIWIGTGTDGLFSYSIGSREIKRISAFKSNCSIQCLLNHDGKIWIATEGDGLHSIDLADGSLKVYHHTDAARSLNSNFVRALQTDRDGNLWIGTFNGLSILDGDGFINIKSDPFVHGSLSQSSVRCICRDNQGGMWLGTWFGGINYWHSSRNRFDHIQMQYGGNSLNDNVVSCMEEDKEGTLWIGTNSGGVNHYDPDRNRFTYYKLQPNAETLSLESNDIKAIYIDDEAGRIYIGAHAGGLSIIDRRKKTLSHSKTSGQLDIYAIEPDGKERLILGTLDGLKSFNILSGAISSLDEDKEGYPIRKLKVRALLKDSWGRLWIGGENGLATYRNTDGQLERCDIQHNASPLQSVFVQSIYESTTKLIWIATRTGLWCYDDKENTFSHYTSADGLANDIIDGIEEDSYGRLWLSTDNGLSCFNPFSGTFRNFSTSDGLQSNQFNPGSHCRRRNGEIMFGGIYGICSFTPSTIEDNPYTPQPIISRLEVFNKPVRPGDGSGILKKSITEADEMTLRHDQNSFTLEFCVTNYLAGRHNTFAYKLDGYDREWYEVKEKRSVSYSNLPHGTYTFMVKAANNDGKWNDTPATLRIRIRCKR